MDNASVSDWCVVLNILDDSQLIAKIEIDRRIKCAGQNLLEFTRDIHVVRCKDKDIITDLVKASTACAAGTGREVKDPLRDAQIQSFQVQDHRTVGDQHLRYLERILHGFWPDHADLAQKYGQGRCDIWRFFVSL